MKDFPSVVSLLKKYAFRPKKRLGQNFLIAEPTMQKIVHACALGSSSTVIEIGSGLGVMTALLASHCQHVTAVEHDEALVTLAQQEWGDQKNIEWLHADILDVDFSTYRHVVVVGNIPYEITSPILFHLLDHAATIQKAVLMMQKEVAQRIVARVGTKEYGILSVQCQAFATCKKLFDVSAKSFTPIPEVTSTVIEMIFRPTCIQETSHFKKIVRTAFGKRRKTLRNALLESFPSKMLGDILTSCGIDGRRRAETLSVDEFICLANRLKTYARSSA